MDTQAFTQAPVKAPATLAGHAGRDAESAALDDEWTVDDVVRSIRKVDRAPHHARRWAAGFGAIVLAAVTVTAGMSAGQTVSKPAALPSRIAAAAAGPATSRAGAVPAPVALPSRVAAGAGHPPVSRSRNVIVVMPADRDYLSATSIPVAGIALGRPHGAAHPLRPRRAVRRRTPRRGHGPRGLRGALRGGARTPRADRPGRCRAPVQRPGQPGAGRRHPVDHARHAVDTR